MKLNLKTNYVNIRNESNQNSGILRKELNENNLTKIDKVSFCQNISTVRVQELEKIVESAMKSFEVMTKNKNTAQQFIQQVKKLQEIHLKEGFDGITRVIKLVLEYNKVKVTLDSIVCSTFKQGNDIITSVTGSIKEKQLLGILGTKEKFYLLMEIKNGNVVKT